MWMDVEDSPVYRRDDIDGYLDVRLTGLRFRKNGAGDRTAVYRVDVVDSAGEGEMYGEAYTVAADYFQETFDLRDGA